jgi:hypothetical protein
MATRDEQAWRDGWYVTASVTAPIDAMRVHHGIGNGAVTNERLAPAHGASRIGRWFSIGDFVGTRSEYTGAHALPRSDWRTVDFWQLPIGAVVNVGFVASHPKFGGAGGGLQVEWLEGDPPRIASPGTGYSWIDREGNA